MIDPALAQVWLERWDVQQEAYAHRREERCAVVAGLVSRAANGKRTPVVVDLGAGPGSLAVRVAARLPQARVIALEADPFLIALGQARYSDRVEFVQAVAGTGDWVDRIGTSPVTAVVSSTALHYPAPEVLAGIYRDLHGLLDGDGLFVNADHFPLPPELATLLRTWGDGGQGWNQWWSAAESDPGLAKAMTLRSSAHLPGGGDNGLTAEAHLALLDAAGFATAEVVWRDGPSAVLAARP